MSDGRTVTARALVNAAGPWVMDAIARSHETSRHRVRLVKGSHIVVPKLYDGDHAYMLQLADRRIVFALSWHGQTALGTTDIAVERPEDAVIDQAEVRYLCEAANSHFVRQVEPSDITHSWCGVRALYDDGAGSAQQVTRDYVLELDRSDGSGAPLLSVFGGKITTGRHLAEEAMARLAPLLGITADRVSRARIFPGGAIDGFDHFVAQVRATWPFLGEERGLRMAHAYGSMLGEMLAGVTAADGMGAKIACGLTEVELRWMRDREWARSGDDVLWRRSKLGLVATGEDRAALDGWWAANG